MMWFKIEVHFCILQNWDFAFFENELQTVWSNTDSVMYSPSTYSYLELIKLVAFVSLKVVGIIFIQHSLIEIFCWDLDYNSTVG